MATKKAVLAFSGGLDTTFCAVYLREELGYRVTTVTVDTGGFSGEELAIIEEKSRRLGCARHLTVDGRRFVYGRFVTYIIKANALRGNSYPLSVGAERVAQAIEVARVARDEKAAAVAHGSTGAGNDQVRFDVALSVLVPEVELVTPVRSLGWSREQEASWLRERGVEVDASVRDYSVNEGLWGTTIGGRETHDSWSFPPEEVFTKTSGAAPAGTGGAPPGEGAPAGQDAAAGEGAVAEAREIVVGFREGLPVSLDGEQMEGVALVAELNRTAGACGVGRGVHIGDTIMGIKGRIVFEAPAPLILIQAHRELEKLVLSGRQRFWKDHLGQVYGDMLHEGLFFDPLMRDLEAMIDSSQRKVTGEARVRLRGGALLVTGVRSPHSVMDRQKASYGETQTLWDHRDAEGFSRIYGVPSILYDENLF